MKILIVRPCGKTAFELGGYCRNALEAIGHITDFFVYHDERISSRFPILGKIEGAIIEKAFLRKISDCDPQLILVIKGDRIPPATITYIRNKFKIPVANWWIDDPLWIKVSSGLSPFYDYFFTNDPPSVEIHMKAGSGNAYYLPLGCDPDIHRTMELSDDENKMFGSETCFCGTMVLRREKMLEAIADFDLKIWSPPVVYCADEGLRIEKSGMSKSSPLFSKFTGKNVWGEALAKVFNASKICLNIHAQGGAGTNMRTFEVTGCGGFLLCEFREALPGLFKIGEEIVCFKDRNELKEMVKYYLFHPEEREPIARRGQARAYQEHTYKHRMQEMLSLIHF